MHLVQTLAGTFVPWQALYADSKVVSTAVTATHVLALLLGGGIAIAADRSTLRAVRATSDQRRYHLSELHATHKVVVSALVVLFVSGLLLAAADIETFLTSPVFWVKLGLLALLCANGLILYRTEHALAAADGAAPTLWRRLGWTARASLTLWLLVAIAGTVLMSV